MNFTIILTWAFALLGFPTIVFTAIHNFRQQSLRKYELELRAKELELELENKKLHILELESENKLLDRKLEISPGVE